MRSSSRDQSRSIAGQESAPTLPLRTGQSFLERLGILYAVQIRLTIVTELYMREMSPKQFFEQVGGTSYDSVRRHFVKLVEYGWLRKVRTEASGRGRPEQLFRSTELAVIDEETWEGLPVSIRDAFTAQLLGEMGDRFATSVIATTFNARRDRILSYVSLELDESGWTQSIGAMDACFRSLSQEQTDAKVRLEKSGEQPTLMIIELGGFEIPRSTRGKASAQLPAAAAGIGAPQWPHRIAKVFADPLNLAIVNELNKATLSATQLHEVLGGATVEGFDRRCKTLASLGWAAKVSSLTGGYRRGATENFYRATSPAVTDAEILARVPTGARVGEPWNAFQRFCAGAIEAVRSGTFNGRTDRHMTLSTLLVDELGWRQVLASLRSCERSLAQIGQEARRRRQAVGDEAPIHPAGFFIAGFAGPLDET